LKRTQVAFICSAAILALLAASGVQLGSGAQSKSERTAASAADRRLSKTIIVTSTADSGPGTLRQALLDAQSYETITFDSNVFPPSNPTTIQLTSGLREITQGYLTIDASNAGVILDGSKAGGEWTPAIDLNSEHNVIRGLQVIHFTGAGIVLNTYAKFNTVGGDRKVGAGPLGQGNLLSDNANGAFFRGAMGNTIVGNLIGTDVSGTSPFGNRFGGIFLNEGAKQNVLGPDNTIAYNGQPGIEIESANSFGNTITQNSLYDNELKGIQLFAGSSFNTSPPLIFDYDLAGGTVAGITCASCTVEIFSDTGSQGEIYEGQTKANNAGAFDFNKGIPFAGPHLTATATDDSGSTSEFSLPTSGTYRKLVFQQGNNYPRAQFQPKRSGELADNHVGSMSQGMWTEDERGWINWANSEILDLGVKRLRFSINTINDHMVDWSTSEFYIPPYLDEFVNAMVDNGFTLTYILNFWDKANHPGGWEDIPSRFQTEEDIQRYLEFVRFIVHHFKGRVQYYELWNEPERPGSAQYIEVASYVNLVRRTVPVIRLEYPEAKIVVGSIDLQFPDSRDWLFSLLNSDVMPLVDVVSSHPMYGVSPEFYAEYYYNYPTIVQEIKDVASAHGFEGSYEGDELVWFTIEGSQWDGWTKRYSNTIAAKYHARGILMHRGMDITTGLAGSSTERVASFNTIGNICTVVAGAEPASLTIEIQSAATNIRSYGFTLANGNLLFALWTDGAAVDEDPGIPATLTLPGITEHTVIGIDVLHGYKQQLVTSEEGGNLVIRDLLVKDYPAILRIAPTKYLYLPSILKDAVVSEVDR
jgi:hypothetical protein